jgi:hypothetical protein
MNQRDLRVGEAPGFLYRVSAPIFFLLCTTAGLLGGSILFLVFGTTATALELNIDVVTIAALCGFFSGLILPIIYMRKRRRKNRDDTTVVPPAVHVTKSDADEPGWHYYDGQRSYGPVTYDTIIGLLEAGRLPPNTMLWQPGMDDWVPHPEVTHRDLYAPPPLPKIGEKLRTPSSGIQPDEDTHSGIPESEPDEELEISTAARSRTSFTMVDWTQSFYILGGTSFVGFLLSEIAHEGKMRVLAATSLILLPLAYVHLRGYVFDPARDALYYPMRILRRSLRLSQVTDANCQTVTKRIRSDPRSFGEIGSIKTRIVTRYNANLSGEFGSRRVIFYSRYKRDQFISLLREYAPHVRITRWS